MISVVTPVMNRESELSAAVESVLRQTDQDWELLIVDDGSSDGSLKIARDFQNADPRIRSFTHPHNMNLGPGTSRNLGVAAARGEFVAFLDSDDLLEPVALASFREAFARYPDVPVVYGRARLSGVRGGGTTIGEGLPWVRADLFPQLVHSNVISTGAVAIRRSVLSTYPFPPEMPSSQDWACWLRLSVRNSFLFVDRDLLQVNTQQHSITGDGLSSVEAHCRYTVIQAEFMRRLAGSLSAGRKVEIRQGLCWRSAECLLRSLFSLRRGRLAASAQWLATWLKVAHDPCTIVDSVQEGIHTMARFRAGVRQPSFIRPAATECEHDFLAF